MDARNTKILLALLGGGPIKRPTVGGGTKYAGYPKPCSKFCSVDDKISDTFRKLAKLCGKTSIVESPEKLPEEALGYVTRGERHYSKKTDA